jgi:P pilus assembly chaperone PapD
MSRSCRVAAVLLLGLARSLTAQGVVVAPHAVYMDHRSRGASITLYNPGAEPIEAGISFFFGYPVTDSAGNFTLIEPDSVTPDLPAASRWVEAFPRRMSIPPLSRQTVRLLARPPAGLPDGEYWARVVVTARGGALPVSGVADSAGIRIGLTLELRTILPLIYRKGALRTGVSIQSVTTERRGDSLEIRTRLTRQGTAAFTGVARGNLVDGAGRSVAAFSEPIAVYYDAEPAFALPVAQLSAGQYRLRLEVASERTDIAPELLLRAPTARDSVAVTLP